eukprot:4422262-Pyramimonas_sp.AAC.1
MGSAQFVPRPVFAARGWRACLRRARRLQVAQTTGAHLVHCPACRGPADVVADFRFASADRAPT